MNLIITKCSDERYWYNNDIGRIFEVVDILLTEYRIQISPNTYGRVDKTDCEIINSDGTVVEKPTVSDIINEYLSTASDYEKSLIIKKKTSTVEGYEYESTPFEHYLLQKLCK